MIFAASSLITIIIEAAMINALGLLISSIGALAPMFKSHNTPTAEATATKEASTTAATKDSFDLTHMSLNELKALINDLRSNGKYPDANMSMFAEQCDILGKKNGFSNDTKMDMLQVFSDQLNQLNGSANNQGAEAWQWSLNMLQGLQAKSGAAIPDYI